jgi:septal ring-binding cell division protein DamX
MATIPPSLEPPPKPTPAPAPTSASPGKRIPLEAPEARSLLAEGKYHEAAGAFAYVARGAKAAYTVNIEVACQTDTVQKGFTAAAGDEAFFVLPYDLRGRSCFVVLWGLYPDRPSAEAALAALPAFFKEAAQPRVVSWESIKK